MKKLYAILLAGISFLSANAQDVHFSQYWASPLTLNPAMTANINGLFRANVNYRNQWFTIPTQNAIAPYQTIHAGFDMALLKNRLENDAFGFGVSFFHDRSGSGVLTTNSILASIAYHKAVDRYGRARIGLGIQAGAYIKQVDLNKLLFEEQFDGVNLNPAQFNQEVNFNSRPIVNPNVNIGLLWQHTPTSMFRYYLGYAAFNVARPKETFFEDNSNRLGVRHVIHGGAQVFLGNGYFSLSPTVLIMLQSQARQYNLGLGVNYQINDNLDIFGGGMYRVMDAVILNVGAEFFGTRVGLSYDINHSDLRNATRAQGALELSAIYVFRKVREGDIQYEKYCPNF